MTEQANLTVELTTEDLRAHEDAASAVMEVLRRKLGSDCVWRVDSDPEHDFYIEGITTLVPFADGLRWALDHCVSEGAVYPAYIYMGDGELGELIFPDDYDGDDGVCDDYEISWQPLHITISARDEDVTEKELKKAREWADKLGLDDDHLDLAELDDE